MHEPYEVGPAETIDQCVAAMQRLVDATAAGEIDSDHSQSIAARINDAFKMLQASEVEDRLAAVKDKLNAQSETKMH